MYDHIERGWLAIQLTSMGCMSVGFVLAFFMLGEQPLGLRLFRGGKHQRVEVQGSNNLKENAPGEGAAVIV